MVEKLVVLSDIWGAKKGLWITSYLGYLQQYFDVTYYDIQQLANIDLDTCSENEVHEAFVKGGIDLAVSFLRNKEKEPSHYLAFSTGGTIAWRANLEGLPMKSLYTVSATRIRFEHEKPKVPMTLLYGTLDTKRPSKEWEKKLGLHTEIMQNYGHRLYADERIIKKVCLDLLGNVTTKLDLAKKAV